MRRLSSHAEGMTLAVDRYVAGLLGLMLVTAGVGAVAGLAFALEDLEQSGEMFDGLGLYLGAAVLGLVAVPAAVAVVALRRLLAGHPTADRWALTAGVLGGLAAVPFGMFHRPLLAVLVVPVLLMVASTSSWSCARSRRASQ